MSDEELLNFVSGQYKTLNKMCLNYEQKRNSHLNPQTPVTQPKTTGKSTHNTISMRWGFGCGVWVLGCGICT